MTSNDAFELATQRLKSTKIPHRNYVSMVKHIDSSVRAADQSELVVCVGPTHVGKSRATREALEVSLTPKMDEQGRIETAYVVAENTGRNGAFSTKGFVVKCLQSLAQPFYGGTPGSDEWTERTAERIERTPEPLLRTALEGALSRREVKCLVIDEAHHVMYAPGKMASKIAIVDSWKCLANSIGIKLVLIGSYKLLDFIPRAPHLSSRKATLEFRRYRKDVDNDLLDWLAVLDAISTLLPLAPSRDSIRDFADLLMDGSLGCVGILERWLRQSLAWSQAEGKRYLTEEALLANRPLEIDLAYIADEIVDGEKAMTRLSSPRAGSYTTGKEGTGSSDRTRTSNRPFQKKARRNPRNGRV